MAWAAIAAVASTGIAVAGQVAQGEAQSNAANYQAQVARNNAIIAEQNAKYAEQAGSVAANNQSQKGAAKIAAVKTQQAANNLDINSGSALAVRKTVAETNTLDTLTTMHNAALQAYGYRNQSVNETAKGELLQNEADFAPIGAGLGAAGTLLGSASSLGFKWSGMPGGDSGVTPKSSSQFADVGIEW